jgi:hypothetical protein
MVDLTAMIEPETDDTSIIPRARVVALQLDRTIEPRGEARERKCCAGPRLTLLKCHVNCHAQRPDFRRKISASIAGQVPLL